jgi:hypothetical protein
MGQYRVSRGMPKRAIVIVQKAGLVRTVLRRSTHVVPDTDKAPPVIIVLGGESCPPAAGQYHKLSNCRPSNLLD